MVKSKPETMARISSEWAEKVATIPTVLGRLELLSSLRDANTGVYVHHGMSMSLGSHTHDVLLNSHKELFTEWLAMGLPEQMKDLKEFVASLPLPAQGPRRRINKNTKNKIVLETWTELEPYRTFVPLSVSRLERDLFLTNLSCIIATLKERATGPQCRGAGSSISGFSEE